MSDESAAEVPDRALRSALEFAVMIAAAAVKLRPPLPVPADLKRFSRFHKLAPTALAQVRAAVEGDTDFRTRLASVATDELVDPIGLLWLSRPDGWVGAIIELLPKAADDDEAAMRREERRRQAAQESAARARAELLAVTAELERERAAKTDVLAETERLRVELDDVRQRLREAQRVEHATAQALAKAEAALLRTRLEPEAPTHAEEPSAVDADKIRDAVERALATSNDAVRHLTEALRELATVDEPQAPLPAAATEGRRVARRKPLPLPGGVLNGSIESAEAWLRASGARVLIDGYNVAKLGWPALDLDHQRQQCIRAAENLAKRWNLELAIVFDGAAIAGAHASTRRRVRIAYSPAGVSADDVLRAEVAAADPVHPVVVVTNDREIIADVAAAGANTVSSEMFLSLAR